MECTLGIIRRLDQISMTCEVIAVMACARVSMSPTQAWCRERMAGYKVPVRVHVLPELPLTAAMKVDKRRLGEVLRDA